MTEYAKYLRKNETPWCPGCGNGIVMKALCDAMNSLAWDMKNDVCVVSGIGCSGRMSSLMEAYTLHSLHGRALPMAEAIARVHPNKHVIVISGDGDGGSIGRSAFMQECNENVDMTYIIVNNFTYALTKGQSSPTTPVGTKAYMCPYGVYVRPFNLCELAIASGATFVARGTTLDVLPLSKMIEAGCKHHGFSFIEVFSGCPENFGRKNGLRTSNDTRSWIDSLVFPKAKFDELSDEEKQGKYPTGILKREHGVIEGNDAYAIHVEEARRLNGGE